ncbi:MAG: hypothetical protein KIS81_08915 [Maricaulaceae bacterium]|nr:hypothetical protein [Maricaulaceae bacterium]
MSRCALLFAAASLCLSAPALAVHNDVPMTERAERLQLEGRRGPSLLRPGYGVGEYTGISQARASSSNIFNVRESRRASVQYTVNAPSLPEEISGTCRGGESRTTIIITFQRDPLAYNCDLSNGAWMSMVTVRGSWTGRLAGNPQRAGEFSWNGVSYEFRTERISGLGISLSGGALGYVISRNGVDIGGLDLNQIMRPNFYLPPQGSPDRDAVAVWALSLFFFIDPASQR